MLGRPSGPMKSRMVVALAETEHLPSGFAYCLDDHGDGAALDVEIRNGERDALAPLIDAGHDEVPGLGGARHIRRLNLPQECTGAELLP